MSMSAMFYKSFLIKRGFMNGIYVKSGGGEGGLGERGWGRIGITPSETQK